MRTSQYGDEVEVGRQIQALDRRTRKLPRTTLSMVVSGLTNRVVQLP